MTETFLIRALATDYPAGRTTEPHVHSWSQIVFAETGLMRLVAGRDEFVIPPSMAVRVPAGVRHEIRMESETRLRTLYIAPPLDAGGDMRVLAVSAFFRELIRRVVALAPLRADDSEHAAFAAIVLRELREAASLPLALRRPQDPRAARAADLAAARVSLAHIARDAGASVRTLQRLFLDETGMSFAQWRTQQRLLAATAALAGGANVARAAESAGYESVSAFVAAFRRQFGNTPGKWAARVSA